MCTCICRCDAGLRCRTRIRRRAPNRFEQMQWLVQPLRSPGGSKTREFRLWKGVGILVSFLCSDLLLTRTSISASLQDVFSTAFFHTEEATEWSNCHFDAKTQLRPTPRGLAATCNASVKENLVSFGVVLAVCVAGYFQKTLFRHYETDADPDYLLTSLAYFLRNLWTHAHSRCRKLIDNLAEA